MLPLVALPPFSLLTINLFFCAFFLLPNRMTRGHRHHRHMLIDISHFLILPPKNKCQLMTRLHNFTRKFFLAANKTLFVLKLAENKYLFIHLQISTFFILFFYCTTHDTVLGVRNKCIYMYTFFSYWLGCYNS